MTDWSLLLWTSETPAGRRCYGKRVHRRDAGATGKGNTGGTPVLREKGTPAGRRCHGKREHRRVAGATGVGDELSL